MDRRYGEPSTRPVRHAHDDIQGAAMSPELLALLRARVATRYYDRPQIIERVARVLQSFSADSFSH
jgi:hypothetical protein